MAKLLPNDVEKAIKNAIFKKAREYGYSSRGRRDNGIFMDDLLDDPEVGLRLKEYLPTEKIRTYIKDGVLNAYTKQQTQLLLDSYSAEKILGDTFNKISLFLIEKRNGINIFRDEDYKIYVLSQGTVTKWETALRKALDKLASCPKLSERQIPAICLQLATQNGDLTEADCDHINRALAAINVSAYYCK